MSGVEEANPPEQIRPATQARRKEQPGWRDRRETALLYVYVSIGSVIGSVLRALASMAALAWFGPEFPWGTLFVNIVGSFVIGFYATLTGPDGRMFAGTYQRQFVMTGICGGFTTFSTFSLEAFLSLQSGKLALAGSYIGTSIVTWLAAVWLGHAIASRLNRLRGS